MRVSFSSEDAKMPTVKYLVELELTDLRLRLLEDSTVV